MSEPILTVEHLKVEFETKYGRAAAVNDVSFSLGKGERLGLVGESGCGKSVTSKSILRLLPSPPAQISGRVFFGGEDLLQKSEAEMLAYRGNRISMIFQEPMMSLDPLYSVGNQLVEVLRLHRKLSGSQAGKEVLNMLAKVGISSPETRMKQYPFELSGGLQQRVMIAMALLCDPDVLIADEPTTALDVTIQAQILNLLLRVNQEFHTSIILITHDLGVIAQIAESVAVMYAGRIVEKADVHTIFHAPRHPYTVGLLNSLPSLKNSNAELETIEGNVPSIYQLPGGCAFHSRCKYAKPVCSREEPPMIDSGGHQVKCWKYAECREGKGGFCNGNDGECKCLSSSGESEKMVSR